MKKLFLIGILLIAFVSCTETSLEDENINATDKEKICPPGDPDC